MPKKKDEETVEVEKVQELELKPETVSLTQVFDPAKEKKYGKGRPEATVPFTYLLTAREGKKVAKLTLDKSNMDSLKGTLRAIFPNL